ncbi:MAG: ABC transporter ATP-binding protein [Candidatus Electrothrix sp. GW3-4]|uniref:ABC transporter ATP-binding protein n=1 Tax=Candidatus Electrothrix sp. GW3-4 TaxID=3126740 RepID=UPI0030D13C25
MSKHIKQQEGNNLLQAVNIHKSYGTKANPVQVLRRVNLEISPGEMLAIVGASGSGKTTLLQLLGCLDVPDKGSLWFAGQGLTELSENRLAAHRNKNIGFIFQFHYLLPEFSALENVMMPGLIAGLAGEKLQEDAHQLLKQVGLEHRVTHRSGELSGGEQQRVALARALIRQPALLLADEPTGNLDSASGQQVFELLTELCQTRSMSVAMVTHNMELARSMDRCLTLKDGCLQGMMAS